VSRTVPQTRVTARQIADEAGVSTATVSVVLNGRAEQIGIKPQTRERVFEAARRLNYVPDQSARSLRGVRSRAVGVLWFLSAPQASYTIGAINSRCVRHGYEMHLTPFLRGPEDTVVALEDFARRKLNAVVIHLSSEHDLLEPRLAGLLKHFEAVVIVSPLPVESEHDSIWHDRLTAVRATADHFVTSGRRHPAIMAPAASNATKVDAFLDQLRLRGVDASRERHLVAIPEASPTPFDQYRHLHQLVPVFDRLLGAEGSTYDALFCSTDDLAMSACAWFRGRGIRVPEDVAVIGFDDTNAGACFDPPLASVMRHDEKLTELIEELLFSRLKQPGLRSRQIHLPMTLIPRASAGTASASAVPVRSRRS